MAIKVLALVQCLVDAGTTGYQDSQNKHLSHSSLPGGPAPAGRGLLQCCRWRSTTEDTMWE
jgi:hypothetical protein